MKRLLFTLILMSFMTIGFSQFISYQPQMLGGSFNYKLIFEQEFYYPQESINAKAEGEVGISFLVGEDGKPYGFNIEKSVSPILDSAFMEVLKYYIWIPGTHDGAISAMRVSLSEKFKIKKYHKLVKKRIYDEPPYPFTPYNPSFIIIDFGKLDIAAKSYYQTNRVNVFQFVSEYIKVPEAALKQAIKGEVELGFIIEASGRLSNFEAITGVGGGCTEEAIRLMRMLDWEPGKLNGEYVRSSYRIKVNFGNTRY